MNAGPHADRVDRRNDNVAYGREAKKKLGTFALRYQFRTMAY